MKFTILRNDLATALSTVLGAIDTRQTMQILAHVLIETTADGLVLTGTNLQIELQAEAKATIDIEGRATVPARKLYDIVRNLPEGAEIKIEFEEAKALVRCGRSRLTLPVITADEYPRMDDRGLDTGVAFSLQESELKRLMQNVAFAMGTNDPRMYLNGMLLHLKGGELRAVASSSVSMGISAKTLEGLPDSDSQIIVPAKSAQEIQRLLADTDSIVSVRMSQTQFTLVGASFRLTTKAIDQRYPDYERMLTLDPLATVTADRDALKRSLSRIALVSNQQSRAVRLSMSADSIVLESAASQNENGEDHVDAIFDGPPDFEIGFSATVLSDVVSAISGEKVVMRMVSPMQQALISSADGAGGRYIIAPMKL